MFAHLHLLVYTQILISYKTLYSILLGHCALHLMPHFHQELFPQITVCLIVCCCSITKLCPQLFVMPWTVACQVPLSVEFSQARILKWVAISISRNPLLSLSANLHYLHLCLFNSKPACLDIMDLCKGKQWSWPQSVYSMLATTEFQVAIEAGVILVSYICYELIAEDTYWGVSVSIDSQVLVILKVITITQAVIQLGAEFGPFSWSWRLGNKQFALEI